MLPLPGGRGGGNFTHTEVPAAHVSSGKRQKFSTMENNGETTSAQKIERPFPKCYCFTHQLLTDGPPHFKGVRKAKKGLGVWISVAYDLRRIEKSHETPNRSFSRSRTQGHREVRDLTGPCLGHFGDSLPRGRGLRGGRRESDTVGWCAGWWGGVLGGVCAGWCVC